MRCPTDGKQGIGRSLQNGGEGNAARSGSETTHRVSYTIISCSINISVTLGVYHSYPAGRLPDRGICLSEFLSAQAVDSERAKEATYGETVGLEATVQSMNCELRGRAICVREPKHEHFSSLSNPELTSAVR